MRIVFPTIAQLHQIPHSLPIAIEIARRYPDCEVHVAYTNPAHLPFIRRLVNDYAPDAPLLIDCLSLDPMNRRRVAHGKSPWKIPLLFANRGYLQSFDAIATPERTSLLLRKMGVTRPRLIWTRHGAGDREVGFSRNVRHFDFVLMAGRRIERRLLERGLIRPGAYAVGVYAKFDWLRPASGAVPRLFDNDRPTVLYNPHFRGSLSSWNEHGMSVLEQFAASDRYNLIFAPHVRLFDPPLPASYEPFRRFIGLPHIRIDLGSERSVDMSYTRAADCYLGDVSSQVVEFLCVPRPCLFINAHAVEWQTDPSYGFWKLGMVTETTQGLTQQIDRAFAEHPRFRQAQQRYFQDSFDLPANTRSAAIGADAILNYLRAFARLRGPVPSTSKGASKAMHIDA